MQYTLSYFDLGGAVDHGARTQANTEDDVAAAPAQLPPHASRPLSSGSSSSTAEDMPRVKGHTCPPPPQPQAPGSSGSQQSTARSGGTYTAGIGED